MSLANFDSSCFEVADTVSIASSPNSESYFMTIETFLSFRSLGLWLSQVFAFETLSPSLFATRIALETSMGLVYLELAYWGT